MDNQTLHAKATSSKVTTPGFLNGGRPHTESSQKKPFRDSAPDPPYEIRMPLPSQYKKSKKPQDETKPAAADALRETNRKPMEFSKKIILGAFLFYGVLALLGYAAWLIRGEWPQQLIDLAWPLAVAITGYLGKSAYENRPKKQGGD